MARRFLYALAVSFIFPFTAFPQYTYRFENFLTKGLENGNVACLIQDSNGFLWIGSGQGLYRYDGYSFKLHNIGSSLTSNTVNCLYEDTDHLLWIGTSGGIYQYDAKSNKLNEFKNLTDKLQISEIVTSINQDNDGNIWFATENHQNRTGGLICYEKTAGRFVKFNENGMFDWLRTIVRDEFGNLWIASSKGVIIFDPQKRTIVKRISSIKEPGQNDSPGSDLSSVYAESPGTIWATAYNGGVTQVKYDSSYSLSLMNLNQRDDNLVSNCVMKMLRDEKGSYWIATLEGISIYNKDYSWHTNLTNSPSDQYGLKASFCTALLEDRSGNLWIGHGGGGLSKLINTKGFIQLTANSVGSAKLAGNLVHSVYVDPEDNLWVGINEKGIQKFSFDSDYTAFPRSRFYPFKHRIIWEMERIDDNQLMIGAEDLGLQIFNESTGEFRRVFDSNAALVRKLSDNTILFSEGHHLYNIHDVNGRMHFKEVIPDSSVRKRIIWPTYSCISKESDQYYWISTWQGDIYRYDVNRQRFTKPEINPYELLRISHVHPDKNGNLWVTAFEGVYKFKIANVNPEEVALNLARKFIEKDGLVTKSGASNLFTASMVEDEKGNLWLGQVGLTKLEPGSEKVEVYDVADGLPGNTISQSTAARTKSGHLVFGSTDGVFLFHPDDIRTNPVPPPMVITNFSILNNLSTNVKKEIELKHYENVITFEFSALDFTLSSKNQYAYQMEGFDKDWIYCGARRTATYTNLNHGTYTFRVKGSNNDGVWNEEGASISITILPPPWKTWWAYTAYAIAVIALIVLGRNEIIKREQLKATAKLKEVEAEKYHELDIMKSRFFANISHEFRTPLTLLLGPIERRLSTASDKADKNELGTMHRNANRLLTLVNQLLDLSRLESGSLKLKCQWANLNDAVSFFSSQFASMADSRNIKFTIEFQQRVDLFFDFEKLEKIVTNLLGNAFKFTQQHGSITVTVNSLGPNEFINGAASITISDSGIGINPSELPRIFDRFYQVDSSATRQYEGSGIGLALVKELVDLHHGTVSVVSIPGQGTTFTVRLPLGKEHLSADEISSDTADLNSERTLLEAEEMMDGKEVVLDQSSLPKVLVVEDNADLRHYLRSSLSDKYNILEAIDGADGLTKAIDQVPDLIISDLMMPVMDGIQLTLKLKRDEKTSHIPIILLTAKAEVLTKLEGLRTGADDYMTKPFSQEELSTRIHNLITIRRNLQKKYSSQLQLMPSQIVVDSMEDRFVKKVMTIIEQHIDDPSFSVEALAEEAAMSNTQLYRKLKQVTGFTPNEVIRNTRLERAAALLRQRAGNVADIAYQVGFNNLSYFSKCFKEKFGTSPSEFTILKSDSD